MNYNQYCDLHSATSAILSTATAAGGEIPAWVWSADAALIEHDRTHGCLLADHTNAYHDLWENVITLIPSDKYATLPSFY